MKHLYRPEECPNYPHGFRGQPVPKGSCPLCGRNSRAYLLGESLATWAVIGAFVASAALISWAIVALTIWVASW